MSARTRIRDAISGRFRERKDADPSTTVEETISKTGSDIAKLRWRLATCEAVMRETAGDLRNAVMHHSIRPDKLSEWAGRLEDTAFDRIPEEDV